MRRFWMMIALALCVGCKAYEAPEAVQNAAQHQLEDLVLLEAELIPLVPADAVIEYKTITGETKTAPARRLWTERVRAMLFRTAGFVAWSRGETYDPKAAFKKLFDDVDISAEDSE